MMRDQAGRSTLNTRNEANPSMHVATTKYLDMHTSAAYLVCLAELDARWD